jgi:hypothetical protein
MNRLAPISSGMRVKSGLKSGAITCYDDSLGYMVPIVTPCSTPTTVPPAPTPTPGVQWLSCQSCAGTKMANGDLQPARCEVCFM